MIDVDKLEDIFVEFIYKSFGGTDKRQEDDIREDFRYFYNKIKEIV